MNDTIDLRIYFAGLSVLRPYATGIQALVVDARSPESTNIQWPTDASGRPDLPEPHYPVIQFNWDDAVGDRQVFGHFTDSIGQEKGYWLLDKDVVTLDPETQIVEENFDQLDQPLNEETPSDGKSARSLRWISPLPSANGTPPELIDGLEEPFNSPAADQLLAGVVRLNKGALRPAGFASEQAHFVVWKFGSKTQAIASVVEYSATVQGSSVQFAATKFDGSPGDTLELLPARNGEKNRLEVWVLNRSWDAIEKQRPPRPVELNKTNSEYLYFHHLVQGAPSPSKVLPQGQKLVAPGAVSPALRPCEDPGMRRLYFPTARGQMSAAAPCSPAY
jgi:hypothetical protein